jgi:alpha-L-fucosidase
MSKAILMDSIFSTRPSCLLRNSLLMILAWFMTIHAAFSQVQVPAGIPESDLMRIATEIKPSARQLAWQQLETTAFIHFGMNTFYNREWGEGNEDPARFNPRQLNTDQWARMLRDAGLRMMILTCKHHDGFCLWPSRMTSHTVAASPWLGGKGDLVRLAAESCRKYGLKFGIYLSPWDKHEATYGSPAYNTFFMAQITELLTQYGKIDEVWFDGACGEGPNGKRQQYDWASWYSLIRKLQPDAVIAIMGPDVRWVGTESGYGRETEWSVVPLSLSSPDSVAAASQQQELSEGFLPPGDMTEPDLGSRNKIRDAKNLIWYPSEVDVSIRPGWFWHPAENGRVKSAVKLLDIYFCSVGRNSQLLLNIPPDTNGLIHAADSVSLREWRQSIDAISRKNYLSNAEAVTGNQKITPAVMSDGDPTTAWSPEPDSTYTLELILEETAEFDVLLLQEDLSHGQRTELFELEAFCEGRWKMICHGTTIGYKRLLRFDPVSTNRVRLRIRQSRLSPHIGEIGLYRFLPSVVAFPASAAFRDSVVVRLSSPGKETVIRYTTNGSLPDENSAIYTSPLCFRESVTLNCRAFRADGTSGFPVAYTYHKSGFDLTLAVPPDERYPGDGAAGLCDGLRGSTDYADGRWCGFPGKDMVATLDLGKTLPIHEFSAGFCVNTKSWIFPPSAWIIEISVDGLSYTEVSHERVNQPLSDTEEILTLTLKKDCTARFVRIRAVNAGLLPEWHPGHGEPAWLFADEIMIR